MIWYIQELLLKHKDTLIFNRKTLLLQATQKPFGSQRGDVLNPTPYQLKH